MRIREATVDDTPRLIEMAARFLLSSHYGELFSVETTPALLATLIVNVLSMGVILVAEVDEFPTEKKTLVGMLAMVALPHVFTGKKLAEEVAWWVEPEHRGGTLGPKMLRQGEEWATRNGANMVKMVAPAGSTVGEFYEHIGYRPVETAYIKSI